MRTFVPCLLIVTGGCSEIVHTPFGPEETSTPRIDLVVRGLGFEAYATSELWIQHRASGESQFASIDELGRFEAVFPMAHDPDTTAEALFVLFVDRDANDRCGERDAVFVLSAQIVVDDSAASGTGFAELDLASLSMREIDCSAVSP